MRVESIKYQPTMKLPILKDKIDLEQAVNHLEQAVNHSVNKMGLHNHESDHWCFPARKISIKRGNVEEDSKME